MSTQADETTRFQELRQTIANVLDVDPQTITEDARFVEELGVDSLMALEVMVVLEKKYKIKLAEGELKQITCLRNVWDLLASKGVVNE